jgi:hypothetical protein
MTIKLVPFGGEAKILFSHDRDYFVVSPLFELAGGYATPEAAAEAWNAGATYNPDTHVVVPKELNIAIRTAIHVAQSNYKRVSESDIYKAIIKAAQEKSE